VTCAGLRFCCWPASNAPYLATTGSTGGLPLSSPGGCLSPRPRLLRVLSVVFSPIRPAPNTVTSRNLYHPVHATIPTTRDLSPTACDCGCGPVAFLSSSPETSRLLAAVDQILLQSMLHVDCLSVSSSHCLLTQNCLEHCRLLFHLLQPQHLSARDPLPPVAQSFSSSNSLWWLQPFHPICNTNKLSYAVR
jgi:hypothetical protein